MEINIDLTKLPSLWHEFNEFNFVSRDSGLIMSRPRILRLLRIAFSAGCGITCLLLIVLWVRSYSLADLFGKQRTRAFGITAMSAKGRVTIWLGETRKVMNSVWYTIPLKNVANVESIDNDMGFATYTQERNGPSGLVRFGVKFPFWFIVLLPAVLAASSWIPWRFSLRTFLIATTLVALVLGLAVAFR